jgi:hypothetical protein
MAADLPENATFTNASFFFRKMKRNMATARSVPILMCRVVTNDASDYINLFVRIIHIIFCHSL